MASGCYIAFHDRFMASLLGRQSAMQYAYEDQLAALRAALHDAEALHDARSPDDDARVARLRDLEARSTALESRASRLEEWLADGEADATTDRRAPRDAIRRAANDGVPVDARLDVLEQRQERAIRTASEHVKGTAWRLQGALAELGLAATQERNSAAGGPFIPLPAGRSTIDADLDALRGDLAHRAVLAAAAARLPLRQPLPGPLDVTSGFGARRDPFLGRMALHSGIDLREEQGGDVQAAANGTVTMAGPEKGYGTMVEIDHGNGYSTRYAHLSSAIVAVGRHVTAGTVVGQVGTTGRSTGPHLHYEIRIAGEPIDPARYLALAATIAGR